MKIKTISWDFAPGKTLVDNIYKIDAVTDRESGIRWILLVYKQLDLEDSQIHVDDGESYHDGTVSRVYGSIGDTEAFVAEYLDSPVYLITLSGHYKGKHISVQVHLNLKWVYIGCEETELHLAEEIEKKLHVL